MDDPKYKRKSTSRILLCPLAYLVLFLVITGIGSCTWGGSSQSPDAFQGKPPANISVSPGTQESPPLASSEKKQESSAVTLEREAGKTVVNIPVMHSTRVNPEYEHPVLTLDFFPAVPHCTLPEIDTIPLIQTLRMKQADDNHTRWASLHLTLNSKVGFLVSRPRPTLVKLLLEPLPVEESRTGGESPPSETADTDTILRDIRFSKDRENNQLITLNTTGPGKYEILSSTGTRIKLLLPDINIPAEHVKLYNLKKFETLATSALLQNSPRGGVLEIKARARSPIHIERSPEGLSLKIDREPAAPPSGIDAEHTGTVGQNQHSEPLPETNQVQTAVLMDQTETGPSQKHYTGRPISIVLQDAQVEHILRLIESVAGYSFVLGQDVSGRITLSLHNVPWDQALDIVLKELNLKLEVQQGNILRIITYNKFNQEQAQEIKEEQQRAQKILAQRDKQESKLEAAPLRTRYIQVNYTTASQLEPQLQSFLTDRGELSSDTRTNQLIVHDTASSIKTVKNVVDRLDRPERQVLIEARLVYVTDDFQRSLGIDWDVDFENSGGTTTGSSDLAVNLSSDEASTFDLGGLISKVSGSDLFTLDAQLQLGESQHQVQTVSSPRVLTLNNFRAEMSQGTKIATQAESESGGTTTEYVEAVIDLSVLPQITPDNKIILDLEISDDSPTGAGDDIETRSATTKLIVDNEETVVIGGVQQLQETGGSDRVPGVSNIPLLGWLFQNKDIQKSKRELLIFIHPKIIE